MVQLHAKHRCGFWPFFKATLGYLDCAGSDDRFNNDTCFHAVFKVNKSWLTNGRWLSAGKYHRQTENWLGYRFYKCEVFSGCFQRGGLVHNNRRSTDNSESSLEGKTL